jgi:hypothetical protein
VAYTFWVKKWKIGVKTATNGSTVGWRTHFKRGERMTQKRVTIGTKISEEDFERIELKGKINGLSISALVKLLVMGYKDGDIEIKDGEIVRENNEEFFHYEETPLGELIEREFDKLRSRNYPESFICKWKRTIIDGIRSQVEMMPKKYDPRRMRSDDWGC